MNLSKDKKINLMYKYDPNKYPLFLRVKSEDVTLKFVFDNIRNIGLSALVFVVGVVMIKGEPISSLLSIPYTQIIIGSLLCLSGFFLL